jgi:hypothetical protein
VDRAGHSGARQSREPGIHSHGKAQDAHGGDELIAAVIMDSRFFAELVIGPAEGWTRRLSSGMTIQAWCSAISPSVDGAWARTSSDFG